MFDIDIHEFGFPIDFCTQLIKNMFQVRNYRNLNIDQISDSSEIHHYMSIALAYDLPPI